jgi:hypothetical protein
MLSSGEDGHYFFARKDRKGTKLDTFPEDDVKTTRFKAFPGFPVFKSFVGNIRKYYIDRAPSKGFKITIKQVIQKEFRKKFKDTIYDNQKDLFDTVGLHLYKGTLEAVEDESEDESEL